MKSKGALQEADSTANLAPLGHGLDGAGSLARVSACHARKEGNEEADIRVFLSGCETLFCQVWR